MGWAGKAAEISSRPSGRGGGGSERGPKGMGEGAAGLRRPHPPPSASSPKHTSSQTAPGGSAEFQKRKPPEGLFRPVGRPEVILPRWDFEIIVKSPRRRSGGRTLRLVPELEMTQDSLDDAGSVYQAHHLQRPGATAAEQRIGFKIRAAKNHVVSGTAIVQPRHDARVEICEIRVIRGSFFGVGFFPSRGLDSHLSPPDGRARANVPESPG